jgi:hypothetical protein
VSIICECWSTSAVRCAECTRQNRSWHRGTAGVRGENWATDVAYRRPDLLKHPWPDTPKAWAIARRWVGDLAKGYPPELLEEFTELVMRGARARWEAWRSDPVGVRQLLSMRRRPMLWGRRRRQGEPMRERERSQ